MARRLLGVLALGVVCIGAGVSGGLLYGASTNASVPSSVPLASTPPPIPEAAPRLPTTGRPLQRRSFLSRLIPPPAEGGRADSLVPRGVEVVVNRLPLERKVAQLFLVGFEGVDPTSRFAGDFRARDYGGLVLEARNYENPEQAGGLTNGLSDVSRAAGHLPPLIMTAQEGGDFSEIPDVGPPKPPGRIGSPREAARAASASARDLRRLGINGVLAPVLDVGQSREGGITERSYSDEPERVAEYARATIEAYQRERVLAAPKHFPGLGAATQATEAGPATVGLSLRELAARDLRPFAAAVDVGAKGMVVGHGLYPIDNYVIPASLSSAVSSKLLRGELGFSGLVIADDLASPALTGLSRSVPDSAVDALRAGADMIWISGGAGEREAAYVAVLNAVRKREVSRRRIDDAVTRVLATKREMRLIPSR